MENPHPPIARYLRERRESAGLTRAALSTVAGISPGLIQKIEQGTRTPTLEALTALFDALEVPDLFRDHLVALSLSDRYDSSAPEPTFEVPAVDRVLLDAIAHPASLQDYSTFDILAANAAWIRFFPGLVPGTTLLEWMLLDPRARTAMIDWHLQVHLIVYGFRVMSPGVVPQKRIDELIAACSRAPEWDEFWTTEPIAPTHLDLPVQRIREPDTGTVLTMVMHALEPMIPRRDWALVAFCPVPEQSQSR
ncbi:helix-turn-helix domain-containing protein [Nocardia alba]|uniref:helix-turn-helix domain-containing protein n=1 Tax=Nocardia alba TaxID=225051 RepID=UPI000A03B5AE|nr:helix-turn-helix domain-containing protein [Nocardia alba]